MQELETAAGEIAILGRTVWDDLTALFVAYAFSVVGAIIILVVGYAIAGLVERSVYATLKRVRGFDETLRRFLSKTLRYAILVMVGVTVLSQFGVQTASIIAAIGAIGLAVGLALQGTLQNIAAGIMLLVLRPFRVGEAITTANVNGTVEEIGLFATEVRGLDGVYIFVPNSQLWNVVVTNTSRNAIRRAELTLALTAADDAELARAKMLEIVRADARVLDTPAPDASVSTDADPVIALTYWTSTADFGKAKAELSQALRRLRPAPAGA